MKIVRGNKLLDIFELPTGFGQVVLDLGTGDGRFIFKNAQKHPSILYIGVDPSQKQLGIYSKEATKRKLTNTLFVLAAVENLPSELNEVADKVFVLYPWGSLLQGVATADQKTLQTLRTLLRPNGLLEIVYGYSSESDYGEYKRLNLDNLDIEYIKNDLIPKFETAGFTVVSTELLNKSQRGNYESTWSKKLSFGRDRAVVKLVFKLSQ